MNQLTLDELVQLPWTRCGPTKDSQAGEEFYKITIDELPAFVVVGSTPYEVITNADRTLRVFLASRLDNGLPIPRPGQPAPAASAPPTPGAPMNPLLTPRAKSGPVPLPKRTGTSPAIHMPQQPGTNTAPASPPPGAPDPLHPADERSPR
jgi:predicted RNase H-like HicB family nuclease